MNLLDLFVAFVLLGVLEAIIKPVAIRVIQWKVIKYGALAMSFLDQHVKDFTDLEGEQIENALRNYMEEVTRTEWTDRDLDKIFRLHDMRLIKGN